MGDKAGLRTETRLHTRHIEAILDIPSDLVLVLDPDCVVGYANGTFFQRSGLNSDQVIGRHLLEILPPELANRRIQTIQQVMQDGAPVRFEDHGVIGWYDNMVYPLLGDDGKIEWVAVVARDLTNRKQIEEELKESCLTIQALLNAPTDIVALLETDGRIVLANETIARQFGTTQEELVGVSFWGLSPVQVVESRKDYFNQVIQTRQPVRFEDRGVANFLDLVMYPVLNIAGEVERVAIVARNISRLKETEEALRRSESLLRTVVNETPVILVAIDASGVLQLMEGKALVGSGFRAENILGRNIFDILKDFPVARGLFQRSLMGETINYNLALPNGKIFETAFIPEQDEHGTITGVFAVAVDVTEKHLSVIELQESRNLLAQRVEERTAELAKANQELKLTARRAEVMARIATRFNAQIERQAVIQTICEEALQVCGYSAATVHIYDEERDHLYIAATYGEQQENLARLAPMPRYIYENAIQTEGPVMVLPDLRADPPPQDTELRDLMDARTMVILTLLHGNDLIGAFAVYSFGEVRLPTDEELVLLQGLADLASTALAKAIYLQQMVDSRARLQVLSRRMVEIQENEQRKLGRELHDQVGQMLTSLKIGLEQMAKNADHEFISGTTSIQEDIESASQQVKAILDQVRDISRELRPPMLDELGLLPALITGVQRFNEQTGASVDFRHSGLYERLPEVLENTVFRMVQEGLTNIVRHSGVKEASVIIQRDDDRLTVQVRDQGHGFHLDRLNNRQPTAGLSGMRERIEMCGGKFTIESTPGKGTCLTAEFSIKQADTPIYEM